MLDAAIETLRTYYAEIPALGGWEAVRVIIFDGDRPLGRVVMLL